MQTFDPKRHPNLVKLDNKVRELLLTPEAAKWDVARTEWEICKIHPVYWMEKFGWVRPGAIDVGGGSESARPVQFVLNPVQLQIADKICAHFTESTFTRVQIIILKHRKAGISTLSAAFIYWLMRFHNLHAFAIADLSSHTDNIMEMVKLFHEKDTCGRGCSDPSKLPLRSVPMPKHKSGLKLSNGVIIEQDTGENSNPGTSGTINALHMSENSKWRDPERAETSLLNSIPRTGFSFVIKESTAYGLNKFAQDCEDAEVGKSAWEFCFITWLDMPDCCKEEYPGEPQDLSTEEKELMATYKKMTFGHVKFMRDQVELLGSREQFRQDFPLNSREPFLITGANFFNTILVQQRIDIIKFYRDWKENGLDGLKGKYPDIIERLKSHPRGLQEALTDMERNCVCPSMVEFYDNQANVSYFVNNDAKPTDGAATMFRYPSPTHKYIVWVDPAEGKKSSEYVSDNSIIEVLDCFSMEQVMEWGGTFDEEVTASYAVRIAKMYNNAVLVVETNNKCGGTVLECLKREGYKNLYHRETVSSNKIKRELGWDTKMSIKKDVLNQLKLDFKNGLVLIHSLQALEEMMFFIDQNGKLCAASGHNDDRVMSLAGCVKVIAITPTIRQRSRPADLMPNELVSSYASGGTKLNRNTEAIGRYM